jgi:hypothetical protein
VVGRRQRALQCACILPCREQQTGDGCRVSAREQARSRSTAGGGACYQEAESPPPAPGSSTGSSTPQKAYTSASVWLRCIVCGASPLSRLPVQAQANPVVHTTGHAPRSGVRTGLAHRAPGLPSIACASPHPSVDAGHPNAVWRVPSWRVRTVGPEGSPPRTPHALSSCGVREASASTRRRC